MPTFRSSIWLVLIGVAHTGLMLTSIYCIYRINISEAGLPSFGDTHQTLWVNTALFGFIGSLLFFGRKAYVYLITDKFFRVEADIVAERGVAPALVEGRLRSRTIGYYMYLSLRPLGGIVIGPIVAMLILGGLTTLTKSAAMNASSLSPAGLFLIYLFSVVGGYTSSDMFDYLSKIGSRLTSKSRTESAMRRYAL
jgi:hypothetical protein